MSNEEGLRERLLKFRYIISNDSAAMTYQSMGQYRTMLLVELDEALKPLESIEPPPILAALVDAMLSIGGDVEGCGRYDELTRANYELRKLKE